MAVKALKPAAPAPDPLAFIEGRSSAPVATPAELPKAEPAKPEEPAGDDGKKNAVFPLRLDRPLLLRLDRECKRRGGMSRAAYIRQLLADNLPELPE